MATLVRGSAVTSAMLLRVPADAGAESAVPAAFGLSQVLMTLGLIFLPGALLTVSRARRIGRSSSTARAWPGS